MKIGCKIQQYKLENGKVIFGLGMIPKGGVPEIQITPARGLLSFRSQPALPEKLQTHNELNLSKTKQSNDQSEKALF